MVARVPLPEPFASEPFSTAAALRGGVTPKRLRGRDLDAPFSGVRTSTPPGDVRAFAQAYAQRMRDGHTFTGLTAARLWGLPVPGRWTRDELLVIGVPARTTRTRAKGVRTREFDPDRFTVSELDGLPLVDPPGTVLSLARDLAHDDLVALVDALITPSRRYPDLRFAERPCSTTAALESLAERCRRKRGASAFAAAVADARPGVDSPQETRTRLAIIATGLPEPVAQFAVQLPDGKRAELDLAYPELKIAIEYEGEHHLTDAAQWSKDIRRQEMLESLGWIVVRVTKADLRNEARELERRVRAALARRAREA